MDEKRREQVKQAICLMHHRLHDKKYQSIVEEQMQQFIISKVEEKYVFVFCLLDSRNSYWLAQCSYSTVR